MQEEWPKYYAFHIFEATSDTRKIKCRGEVIRVYDPNVPNGGADFWKYTNTETFGEHDVPAGYEVEVINGSAGLTKSG